MWREPGNIHGFVPDGLFHRPGWVTAPTPTETTIFGMDVTPVVCAYSPHYYRHISCVKLRLIINIAQGPSSGAIEHNDNNNVTLGHHTLGI